MVRWRPIEYKWSGKNSTITKSIKSGRPADRSLRINKYQVWTPQRTPLGRHGHESSGASDTYLPTYPEEGCPLDAYPSVTLTPLQDKAQTCVSVLAHSGVAMGFILSEVNVTEGPDSVSRILLYATSGTGSRRSILVKGVGPSAKKEFGRPPSQPAPAKPSCNIFLLGKWVEP